jgi:hypothetical protein
MVDNALTPNSLATPQLTVVVIVLQGRKSLCRCLTALSRQVGVEYFEIIVPYDERFSELFACRKDFPEVQFLPFVGIRTYAELRALGVREARGEIIALMEDHCTPEFDWCAQILKAHAAPHAAIGGAVDKETTDSALNWALYFADYVRYKNPVPEGPTNELTDCNVTYKRSALDAIADVWHAEFHEPVVHGALQARGETLWLSPHIVVHQQRSLRIGDALRDRYAFGRLFGSGRVSSISPLQRLIHIGSAILLPLLLVGRIAAHIFRKRCCMIEFVRALPALVLLNTIWAWGELVGYLTGRPEDSLTPRHRVGTIAQSVQQAKK